MMNKSMEKQRPDVLNYTVIPGDIEKNSRSFMFEKPVHDKLF